MTARETDYSNSQTKKHRDTPMPFPVLYVLHISTFVFVYR